MPKHQKGKFKKGKLHGKLLDLRKSKDPLNGLKDCKVIKKIDCYMLTTGKVLFLLEQFAG